MAEIIGLDQAVIEKLRSLPVEQQEVLDFVESLFQKTLSKTAEPKLSLQRVAALPLEERHKLIAPFIAATAENFKTDPELTEFAALDGSDSSHVWGKFHQKYSENSWQV